MTVFQVRPQTLKDFCGKKAIKKNLLAYLNSAKLRNQALDHCLLYGPAGVGKTTLSRIIANELNQKLKIIQGPELQEKSDVINLIYSLKENSVIFIDEIHSINQKCFELLYSAMEDFLINIEIGKEYNKKTTTVPIPRFTLIGATTKLGNIPTPFEERFGIVINIGEYQEEEILNILNFAVKVCELEVDESALDLIAKRSKGIPRIAKRILSRYIDYALAQKNLSTKKILENIGVYEYGLNEIDLNYLSCIKANKKVGLKTISQILNVDEKTILDKIEPFLIKKNLIFKSINGRSLSEKGIEFISKFDKQNNSKEVVNV
ncbi:MAG: Holliday junction branch migration DNA helicase RuvB [Malacoplasma sp.]|nr:Holliday junction branch migration DNA helicase RuvB [Malacoplasma sp.]